MYNRFYGFSEKPFNVTPDPKFFYLGQSHQKSLDALLYGIGERKGFISISGEPGTGKTTLLHHVLNTLAPNVKAVFINQTRMTPKQLLKDILRKLKLTPKDQNKISLIRHLNEHLVSSLPHDGNLAILMDEAQGLSLEVLEELRMLSNLETSSSKLIQIVLVGQPELEDKLNSRELRQLKQRIAIRSQLRGFSMEESREYISHRLGLVGRRASEVFSTEAVGLICRQAGGIPRAINLLCDNVLLDGWRRREKRIRPATVKEVLADRGLVSPENERRSSPEGDFERKPPKIVSRRKVPASSGYRVAGVLLLFFLIAAAGGYVFLPYKDYIFAGLDVAAGINGSLIPRGEFVRLPLPARPSPTAEAKADGSNPAVRINGGDPLGAVRTDPQKGEAKIASVGPGDTFFSILRTHYGHANATLLDYVLKSNPEIGNPHELKVNDQVRMPILDDAILIQESAGGKFRIHLATFTNRSFAERFGKEGILKGKRVEIEDRRISSEETWFRLYVGGYDDREETRKALSILKKRGALGFYPPES